MIPALIFLLFFFSAILIKSAEMVIVAVRRLAHALQAGVFAISALVLAIGTSLPELFVGLTSALGGTPNLSFGNVLGANIANISLVAGLSAFITGRVNVVGDYLKKDVFMALVAGVLPLLLAIDGRLSRVDGLILLATYGAYVTSLFRERYLEIAEEHKKESFFVGLLHQVNHVDMAKARNYGRLFIGLALVLFSADIIVRLAKQFASVANIPVFLVGLIILSIGTTLPELAFSFKSLANRTPSMFFGNILGSIIANSTLVIGLVATIAPVEIMALDENIIAGIAFVVIFLLFWLLIRTKHRLDRWEAGFLLLLYLIFVVVEFL
ncbi:hypothetical protein A2630_03930 [Candidatus Woesebacteria bacterium RIFCSPHIGHO2_01_FULL_44_10]|uniref:Sodium/calcium exchanger membrane region domain-containing protein n=1 Tax=Candidatus Woesebacteria bacterium RIFCSPLOWO2_01_FULL_44_14 TaxID=1802525 RepID=A0A1F8C081_9BACT|nr:MAG: hypothetical protein A2630_03930 [Candidatus Woesebacteria bacterium RIFCSPHIGHO2_01_FULL_44_10]OGM55977.1 MAG: hypothetical protein A3F62_05380 [Candidatus Woesebacteria bacterium RIFCSPHIGHO2_12_FULL_44_11]OGM69771.1 MAG: hypothetical protein A2975_00235 [Candidatus Woesebacteria bacterium RIFCSPLOWO2_01_FULL_44_14]